MNFGEILDRWEKQTPGNRIYDKDKSIRNAASIEASSSDAITTRDGKRNPARRSMLLRKKPDAFIDLHGLSSEEAWIALQSFFQNSREKGLEKIQIIHGKGNHSGLDSSGTGTSQWGTTGSRFPSATLRDLSRRFIEACPFAGESGHSPAREGGTGATWVILK